MTSENARLYKQKGRGNSPKISLLRNRNAVPAGEPFIWFTREMLESPAWRAMPPVARQIVDRIVIEHLHHAGNENGKLPVTYDDFARYGIRRMSIKFGISVAVALGWVDVVEQGHRGAADDRRAARYALTWLDRWDTTPRTNRWKQFDEAGAKGTVAEIRRQHIAALNWRAAGRCVS
jgi:hypothetical protein